MATIENTESIEELNAQIEAEARKGDISLDEAVYQEARKDPYKPILFGGNLDASTAFFARDLGRHEVIQGQPLIGDAGQRVRKAVFRYLFAYWRRPPKTRTVGTGRAACPADEHGSVQARRQQSLSDECEGASAALCGASCWSVVLQAVISSPWEPKRSIGSSPTPTARSSTPSGNAPTSSRPSSPSRSEAECEWADRRKAGHACAPAAPLAAQPNLAGTLSRPARHPSGTITPEENRVEEN